MAVVQNPTGSRVYHAPVMKGSTDSPGVHLPPPLFYAAAVIAGWVLDRRWPLPIDGPTGTVLGWIFVAAWALLAGSAIGLFRRKHTSMIPIRPAATLVTSGPYRLTRNPMYLSLAILYIAVTLVLDSWWPLFLLPAVLAIVDRVVILREERYLASAFPQLYDEYRRRVRRWL